ncbi:MAG: NYN domain-containing protein [Anaerolineales bacterium]|nr:NYN domain-containing protein [Anaerolineales bacterium]
MPYLIDGHNLIPKLGLRLDDPEDEIELVRLLQDFGRIRRQQADVYFDGAPPGSAGLRKFGRVKAYFVPRGQTADSAIRRRLDNLGGDAKNWTVVSSDHEVQNAARARRAQAMRSEEFAKQLRETLASARTKKRAEEKPSAQEVEEWLSLFKRGKE